MFRLWMTDLILSCLFYHRVSDYTLDIMYQSKLVSISTIILYRHTL